MSTQVHAQSSESQTQLQFRPDERLSIDDILRAHYLQNVITDTSGLTDNMPPSPQVGLFHRTVLQNPSPEWIFSARIRHSQLNDLIFVGEDFVQIQNIQNDDGVLNLVSIGTIQSFASKIRAATTVGRPFIPKEGLPAGQNDPFSNDLKEELFPPEILVLVLEGGDAVFLVAKTSDTSDALRFYRSSFPLPQMPLFRQPGATVAVDNNTGIVALAAYDGFVELLKLHEWGEIAMDFMRNHDTWNPVKSIRPLYAHSLNGTILRMAFLQSSDPTPLVAQLALIASINHRPHLICWEGDLFSGRTAPEPSIQQTPLEDVTSDDIKYNCAKPDLMVPYLHSSGFMLACGTSLHFYKIMAGSIVARAIDTHPDLGSTGLEPQFPQNFQRYPMFTAFTHCFRSEQYQLRKTENFHLLREDGVLLQVAIDNLMGTAGLEFGLAAKLDCYGSQALATFLTTGTLSDPDRLAFAGSMSDGRLLSFGDTYELGRHKAMAPQTLQKLTDWLPNLDAAIVHDDYAGREGLSGSSLFMTSGRQPFGSIAQILHGYKAAVNVTVPMPGLEDLGNATGIWVMQVETSEAQHIFISFVTHTLVLIGSLVDLSVHEIDCTTILVAHEDQYFLQVSRDRLRLFTHHHLMTDTTEDLAELIFDNSTVVLAAAAVPMNAAVVIVYRSPDDCISVGLYVGTNVSDGAMKHQIKGVGTELTNLQYTPTSVTILEVHHTYLAVLGTSDGVLVLCSVNDHSGVAELSRFAVAHGSSTPQTNVIESLCIIGNAASSTYRVLCGLRGGLVMHAALSFDTSEDNQLSITCSSIKSIQLGTHPVKLHTDIVDINHVAFATCGSSILRLSLCSQSCEDIDIHHVWLDDDHEDRPVFKQPVNPVIGIVPTMTKRSQIPSQLAVFMPAGLCLATVLQLGGVMHVQKLPLSLRSNHLGIKVEDQGQSICLEAGTPQKLVYVSCRDTVAISTVLWDIQRSEQQDDTAAWALKRIWRSCLIFVPLNCDKHEEEPSWMPFYIDSRQFTTLELGTFEQITSMCEWTWQSTDDETATPLHHLLVATSVKEGDNTEGRLYFVKVNREGKGTVTCSVSKVKTLKRPIKAMTPLSKTKLVVGDCDGIDVYGPAIDENGSQRWKAWAHYALSDSPRYISTDQSSIYVTGSTKSISVLRYVESDNRHTAGTGGNLIKIFSDELARPTITHLLVNLGTLTSATQGDRSPLHSTKKDAGDEQQILLLSSEDNKIAIISHPREVREASTNINSKTIIATRVPHLITRLAIAPLRPPWLKQFENPAGVIGPDIVGTSPAGAISHLRLLDSRASHLLRYLHNLILYEEAGHEAQRTSKRSPEKRLDSIEAPAIDPLWNVPIYFLETYHTEKRDPSQSHQTDTYMATTENRISGPSTFAVNGDVLDIFIDHNGSAKLLDRLLQETWELSSIINNPELANASERMGNTIDQRLTRFQAIVKVLLGEPREEDTDNDELALLSVKTEEEMDYEGIEASNARELRIAVVRCVRWMRQLWQFL